ncbi:MAG: hypothetical protein NTU73_07210 [Ignavibacteriae bacterium]|nr:hypothetical protein [Ignavibacteriota bacterium]
MKSIKLLVLFIFAVLLFSNVSYSQSIPGGTGRYEALGSNPFMLDPVIDMHNNPAWSTYYKNYVFGDLGRNTVASGQYDLTDQYAGINFKASKEMNLGLVLNKREDNWNAFYNDGTYGVNNRGNQEPIVPLKVLFGYATPTFAFGFAPYYTSWSQDSNNTTGTSVITKSWKSSSLGAQVGMILKMNTAEWFEGAVNFKMNKFSYEDSYSAPAASTYKIENEGGMELSVGLRGWFMANKPNKVALVPYLGFGIYSWNPKITQSPTAWTAILPTYSMMNLNAGIGVNMPVLENGTLATGLSFGYSSYEKKIADTTNYVRTWTTFMLPKFNIGLEWKFVDWLSGRLGYSRSFNSGSDKKTDNVWTPTSTARTIENKMSSASDPVQTINLGIGLHFDRFSLDGTIGERLLKNGPFIITNNSDKNDLYGVFSASYNFNR